MWQEILVAICLVFVIEGLLPFISPRAWREAMFQAIQLNDKTLRIVGFSSMLIGTVLLYLVK